MSDRKKARRAVKDFVLRTAETLPNTTPEDQFVRTPNGRLFLQDLRTLLHAEHEARHVARRVIHEKLELSRKAAEAAQVVAALQAENASLQNAPGTVNYQKESNSKLEMILANRQEWIDAAALCEKERNEAREELSRANQALNNLRDSVRKGTPPLPPPFVSEPGGLSAEDLRKVAQDLLPQFLATFLSPPRGKK